MPSPIAHVLHAAQLRSLADSKTFGRGERYHREGRVSALKRDGRTIKATVSGKGDTYEVKLWVTGDRIAYACTCPMGEEGGFCKHCVAVSLALLEQLQPAGDPVDDADEEVVDEVTVTSAVDMSVGARVIKAPSAVPDDVRRSVFLAGSIDMGAAPDWQRVVATALAAEDGLTILDPRRAEWDDSWEQSVDSAPFREQVEWELAAMERADVIAMYFSAESKAPITLLELGLHAQSGKLIVCCSDGYWRKGNVDVVCRHHGVHQVHDLEALVRAVRARLKTVGR